MANVSNPTEAVEIMKQRFSPAAASGLSGTLQFEIEGDGGGKWAFNIEGGRCDVIAGGVEKPKTTLKIKSEDFVGLTNGTANGMTLFMSGKIKLDGDMGLAMRFQSLFPVK